MRDEGRVLRCEILQAQRVGRDCPTERPPILRDNAALVRDCFRVGDDAGLPTLRTYSLLISGVADAG